MKRIVITSCIAIAAVAANAQEPADTTSTQTPDEGYVLDDFVVTARKQLIKSDAEKTSYEAQEDPDAQSLSALDMLRRVPMVAVDGQDNITVNGRSDFQIYVDGKPNPMLSANPGQLLRSIPASTIARFEVINNPGASYDAEGVGGILNIVLKSAGNLNGYTATLTGIAGNQTQSGSLYAMMQQDKVGVTVNVSAMHYETPEMRLTADRLNTADGSLLNSDGTMKSQFNSLNTSLNLDWKPNDRNIFAFSGSFQRSPFRMYNNSTVAMTDGAGMPLYGYSLSSRNRNRSVGVTAGADYTHLFSADNDRHKLQLSYRLNITPTRSEADNFFSLLDGFPAAGVPEDYDTFDRTSMTENIGQADYTLPLGEMHTFGVGSKLTFRRSSSDASGLDYVHHSTITAAYLTYGLTAGDFALNAGARYEHTHQSARYGATEHDPYSADYNNFVPSLTMSYSFAPVRQLSVGYNMRISRPGISMLNPYIDNSNPLQVETGNPNLRPEKYNNFNLTWMAMWGKVMFNAQAGYSFSNDGITRITEMRDGITYTSYANSLRSRQATASIFLTYNPWTNTRISFNSTTSYSALRSPVDGLSSHGWSEMYMVGVQQTLPWQLQLSANIFGQTGYRGLQMKTGSMFTHMLSLSRSFLSDRLNVSVTAMSPFYSGNKIKMHEWGAAMDNHTTLKINLRSVMVSVSYRFGDLKSKSITPRELDSDLAAPSQQGGGSIPGGIPGTGM